MRIGKNGRNRNPDDIAVDPYASVAQRVLNQAKAEKLWMELIDLERKKLGLAAKDHKHRLVWKKAWGVFACQDCGYQPDPANHVSITPLTSLLRYLEDRAYGPVWTKKEGDGELLAPTVRVLIEHIGARASDSSPAKTK